MLEVSYNPTIPLLGLYMKSSEETYNRVTCLILFTAELFKRAKKWN